MEGMTVTEEEKELRRRCIRHEIPYDEAAAVMIRRYSEKPIPDDHCYTFYDDSRCCHSGSNTLRNKLNIRDFDTFSEAECPTIEPLFEHKNRKSGGPARIRAHLVSLSVEPKSSSQSRFTTFCITQKCINALFADSNQWAHTVNNFLVSL